MRNTLICLLLFISLSQLNAQFVANPSFEGSSANSSCPPYWIPFAEYSTPDTQPNQWGNTAVASDGQTYVSLVSRGNNVSTQDSTSEGIQIKLLQSLFRDTCYAFSIDLACAQTFLFDQFINFQKPLKLKIYGGRNYSDTLELLATTPVIDHYNWKSYQYKITPSKDSLTHLILYADFVTANCYNGNILLDNLVLTDQNIQTIKPSITVDFGSEVELMTSDGASANWSIQSDSVIFNSCATISIIAEKSTVIKASVQTGTCITEELFTVNVNPYVPKIIIPNIITPNGDGKNDCFFITDLEDGSYLSIVDRYGILIFESNNYKNDWYGTFQNKIVPVDTYWYSFKRPFSDISQTGFVTIAY